MGKDPESEKSSATSGAPSLRRVYGYGQEKKGQKGFLFNVRKAVIFTVLGVLDVCEVSVNNDLMVGRDARWETLLFLTISTEII